MSPPPSFRIEPLRRCAHTPRMWRLIPVLLLLAACHSPIYSDADEAKDTCRDFGHEGAALAQCIARRQHEADCRAFANSREFTEAEARRRKCD